MKMRAISLFLIALTMVAIFVSCSKEESETNDDSNTPVPKRKIMRIVDSDGEYLAFSYNSEGKVSKIVGNHNFYSYEPVKTDTVIWTNEYFVIKTLNENKQDTFYINSSGNVIRENGNIIYEYDKDQQLIKVTANYGTTQITTTFVWKDGNIIESDYISPYENLHYQYEYYTDKVNNVFTPFTYKYSLPFGKLTKNLVKRATRNTSNVADYSYEFEADGNVRIVTKSQTGENLSSYNFTYY